MRVGEPSGSALSDLHWIHREQAFALLNCCQQGKPLTDSQLRAVAGIRAYRHQLPNCRQLEVETLIPTQAIQSRGGQAEPLNANLTCRHIPVTSYFFSSSLQRRADDGGER
jgi:hypothetical protein